MPYFQGIHEQCEGRKCDTSALLFHTSLHHKKNIQGTHKMELKLP